MLIYFWARETEHEQGRGRETGRHRIWSRLQALSCQHRARHGAWTHKPRDHHLSQSWTLNGLSHRGAPEELLFNAHLFFERETETEYELGRGRERGRLNPQNRLQALSCQHRARRGAWTREPWDHDLSLSWMPNWPSYPGAPKTVQLFRHFGISWKHNPMPSLRKSFSLPLWVKLSWYQGCSPVCFEGCAEVST